MRDGDEKCNAEALGLPAFLKPSVLLFLLVPSPALFAQDADSNTEDRGGDTYFWQGVDIDMSPEEYRRLYRNNQRHVLDSVVSYTEYKLSSAGIPRTGIRFMEGVAGIAASNKAKLYLNKSKLFAVELNDIADEDQSLLFKMEMDW